jgi:hypothetical protein
MIRISNGPVVPAGPATEASRIVVSQHNARDTGFCTHLEVMREGEEPFTVWGHYDMTEEEAEADALERYAYNFSNRETERLASTITMTPKAK